MVVCRLRGQRACWPPGSGRAFKATPAIRCCWRYSWLICFWSFPAALIVGMMPAGNRTTLFSVTKPGSPLRAVSAGDSSKDQMCHRNPQAFLPTRRSSAGNAAAFLDQERGSWVFTLSVSLSACCPGRPPLCDPREPVTTGAVHSVILRCPGTPTLGFPPGTRACCHQTHTMPLFCVCVSH